MTMSIKRSGSGAGLNFNQTESIASSRAHRAVQTVTGAKTGNLTTRTSDTVGELTMSAGHGITTAARLDLYWEEAGQVKCRVGVVVGTVAVNQVPISGGTGDNLPVDESAIVAKVPQTVDLDFLGDDVIAWLASAGAATGAIFAFIGAAESALGNIILTKTGMQSWSLEQDRYNLANRLAGDTVQKMYVSHNNTASQDMKLVVGLT